MSVFDDIKKQKKKGADSGRGGLDWPTDQWYIERALFLIYGSITTFSIFLFFVFWNSIFLIFPMLMGVAQMLFAILGIDIFTKILVSAGLKEKRETY